MPDSNRAKNVTGWTDMLWIATMCLANALPFALLLLVGMMMKRYGFDNATITLNLGLCLLPWALRPLCHLLPRRTTWNKGTWLLASEAGMAAALMLMARVVATPGWFMPTVALTMVASALAMVHGVMAESLYKEITHNASPTAMRPVYILLHVVAIMLSLGVLTMMAGNMEVITREMRSSWSFAFRMMAIAYILTALLHGWKVLLQKRIFHNVYDEVANVASWRELWTVVRMFLGRGSVSIGSLFFFFFLMPQGLTLCTSSLFLVDSIHRGGMGLAPQEYGLVFGTVGIAGVAAGAMIIVYALRRMRFRQIVIPSALTSFLPPIALYCMCSAHPSSLTVLSLGMFASTMGFGACLVSCLLFLSYYCCGRYKPTFYSVGIALISLSLALSVMLSGSIQREHGYLYYYAFCSLCPMVSMAAAVVLKYKCLK